MILLLSLLLVCLFIAVSFAAYQLSEAKRWREATAEAREQQERQQAELESAKCAVIRHEAESAKSREVAEVQLKLLTQTQQQLEEKFRGLAADALHSNSQLFLDRSREQIQHLVEPVSRSLRRFEEQVQAIELSRAGAYADISAQVGALTQLQERVRQSTDQLKNALRSTGSAGSMG